MILVSDTIAKWRVDPANDRAVQTKGSKKGSAWEDYGDFDTPAIAREVVFAGQTLVHLLQENSKQRRTLTLPRGDVKLSDGRTLRRIVGYNVSVLAKGVIDENTRKGFLETGGWQHVATNFVVTASIDDTVSWGPLLHVSMSHTDHDPTWEEIKAVREAFFPMDMDTGMILPRQEDYVAVHPHCFHIWQLPQYWGLR